MERFVVPSQILWSHPEEAVLIVRLGALTNAIAAIASMSAGSLATGVGGQRDTLQSFLLMVSYFKEAIDAVNSPRTWALVKAGVATGYPLPKPIEHFQQLFSRGKGSIYIQGVR